MAATSSRCDIYLDSRQLYTQIFVLLLLLLLQTIASSSKSESARVGGVEVVKIDHLINIAKIGLVSSPPVQQRRAQRRPDIWIDPSEYAADRPRGTCPNQERATSDEDAGRIW